MSSTPLTQFIMPVITKTVVLLQYPKAGEIGPSGHEVKDDAEKFVAIDRDSGGYPYAVDIDRAHDFRHVEQAVEYRGHFKKLAVRLVTITYTW